MKCSQCGLENRPDARFCKQCGQTLQTQQAVAPTQSATICPACGATAKSRSHFCPRCGKPLPSKPAQPSPSVSDTVPTLSSITQPYTPPPPAPTYAYPPVQAAPPSAPPAAKRSVPRWVGWVAASLALLCIAALVVATIIFGPRLLGGKEPAAAFDARVAITASAAELRVGDPLTITITIDNTGQATFGDLRYQLVGEWEQFLASPTGLAAQHEVDVLPAESDTATFVLQATQAGTAQIHANVTVDTRDPPTTRPVSSEYVVEILIVQ